MTDKLSFEVLGIVKKIQKSVFLKMHFLFQKYILLPNIYLALALPLEQGLRFCFKAGSSIVEGISTQHFDLVIVFHQK